MLNRISEGLTTYLVRKDIVSSDYAEVYTYGFMLMISTVFSSLTVLLLSALICNILIGAIFLAVMMMLRFFCGGYHCSTYFNCWLCTNSISAIVFLIIRLLPAGNLFISFITLVLAVVSAIYIIINSPIEHKNNPQSAKQRKKNKRISRVLATASGLLVAVGFVFFGTNKIFIYFTAVSAALIIDALLMITEKINGRCSNEHS